MQSALSRWFSSCTVPSTQRQRHRCMERHRLVNGMPPSLGRRQRHRSPMTVHRAVVQVVILACSHSSLIAMLPLVSALTTTDTGGVSPSACAAQMAAKSQVGQPCECTDENITVCDYNCSVASGGKVCDAMHVFVCCAIVTTCR